MGFWFIGSCPQKTFSGQSTLFQKILKYFLKDEKYSWLFLNGEHGRISNRKLGQTIERLGEEFTLNCWKEDKKSGLPYIAMGTITRKEAEEIIDTWDKEDCDDGDLGTNIMWFTRRR